MTEGLVILGAYLLGSVPVSAIIHRLGGRHFNTHPDSPTQLYFSFAVWVLIFGPLSGIAKGALLMLASDTLVLPYTITGLACLALILGAQYSIFQHLKPANYTSLVIVGAFLVLDPILGIIFGLLALVLMGLINHIELGLISSALITSIYYVASGYPLDSWPILAGILLGIIIAHFDEFLNLLKGNKTVILDRYKSRHH